MCMDVSVWAGAVVAGADIVVESVFVESVVLELVSPLLQADITPATARIANNFFMYLFLV